MAVQESRTVRDLSCLATQAVTVESAPSAIGPITLDAKQVGARSAGNPHAACDEAGAGNGVTGRTEAPADGESRRQTATPRTCSRPQRLGARVPPESEKAASARRFPRNARGPIVSDVVAGRASVPPRLGTTEARREGRWGVGVTHSTNERWDSCPSDPAEGRG